MTRSGATTFYITSFYLTFFYFNIVYFSLLFFIFPHFVLFCFVLLRETFQTKKRGNLGNGPNRVGGTVGQQVVVFPPKKTCFIGHLFVGLLRSFAGVSRIRHYQSLGGCGVGGGVAQHGTGRG